MARLPGDHSQVGWLPPSYLLYHFSGTTQPCSRRENFGDFGCGTTFSGSSPLTRGKPVDHRLKRRHVGLIPAHAGKTAAQPAWLRCRRAHPRSGGENYDSFDRYLDRPGSSPLTRGKLPRDDRAAAVGRLIPTHAGRTCVRYAGCRRSRAHPPLTRGKLKLPAIQYERLGLIPTHAGKTPLPFRLRSRGRAHPRSRGENFLAVCTCGWRDGSSPLTRGKRRKLLGPSPVPRLIPAHAGKTPFRGAHGRGCAAHPRSRGENAILAFTLKCGCGSSPLARGKRTSGRSVRRSRGLIPAHTGKTAAPGRPRGCRPAHPHSHGENFPASWSIEVPPGSSPLTRGKRGDSCREPDGGGLIPAHAGKTGCSTGLTSATRAHPRSRGENAPLSMIPSVRCGSSPLTRGKHSRNPVQGKS